MHKLTLPITLSPICKQFWPTEDRKSNAIAAPTDISIVTAFFDIGRGEWQKNKILDHSYQRSSATYLERFSHLAKINNQMIVFTSSAFAPKILELRRAFDRDSQTIIFVIDDLFSEPTIAELEARIASKMNDRFRQWTVASDAPEYNFSRYVLVNALKSAFVNTAHAEGAIDAGQAAWIDFGYCRDGQRLDASTRWRFDTRGKMNLFHIRQIDQMPIFEVVKRGTVFFQGCHILVPVSKWSSFASEVGLALEALLTCDLVDDDQTLLLMAYRKNPADFIIHAVDPADWFVIFRNFREGVAAPKVNFAPPKTITAKLRYHLHNLLLAGTSKLILLLDRIR